jgi:replicative DNA helicase
MLIKQGGLTLTDKSNIDIIIKYYPNRSIDTNDLYGIIQDLEDEGVEVIALILDYLKRIRPAEKGENEKAELKNITNELKDLAIYWDIPVITAQQLNRTASAIVDAAIQAKKSDVTKLVGRDGVAGAWEINSMVSPYREVC